MDPVDAWWDSLYLYKVVYDSQWHHCHYHHWRTVHNKTCSAQRLHWKVCSSGHIEDNHQINCVHILGEPVDDASSWCDIKEVGRGTQDVKQQRLVYNWRRQVATVTPDDRHCQYKQT